jgi:tripartite-type tricarboxylate transporter receptor subunit TctC
MELIQMPVVKSLLKLLYKFAAFFLLFITVLHAQEYPNKPIRIVVPTPPGAGPDSDLRQMAPKLSQILGQPVVIENKPGASGKIAAEYVSKASPDGYTFILGTPTVFAIGPFLFNNLNFDIKRDFTPVSLISTTAFALTVNSSVPAQSASSFVALSKSNEQFSNIGDIGLGSTPHLAAEWFNSLAGANLKFIHYNTTTPYADVMGGQISGIFEAILPVYGNVKTGKLKVLAISGKSRSPLLPDVPTFSESGYPAYDPKVWIGLLAPADTPKSIINKVSNAIKEVAKMPETIQQRRDSFSDSIGSTPEEFSQFLESERIKWSEVIKKSNIKIDN